MLTAYYRQLKGIGSVIPTGASVAYSLRLIYPTYSGNCIKVRRASDNTTQDIGFVDGVLDTATLLTFCTGTNGFVETWYDQSGSSNLTQSNTSYQPQIVSSGSLILDGSKVCVNFNNKYMTNTAVSLPLINKSVFLVLSIPSATWATGIYGVGNVSNDYAVNNAYLLFGCVGEGVNGENACLMGNDPPGTRAYTAGYFLSLPNASIAPLTSKTLLTEVKTAGSGYIAANTISGPVNNVYPYEFAANSAAGLILGSRWASPTGYTCACKISEFIYFGSTLNPKPVNKNINNYYSIY